MELSSSSCAEIGVPIDLRWGSQGISGVPKGNQSNCLYDGEWGIALKLMQGNWSSFQIDLHYTKLLHIPALTSVSFKTYEGFLGALCSSVKQIKAPYLFDWEQVIALHAMQGNQASSLSERGVSCFFSS